MTFKPELIPKGCKDENYLLKDTNSASTIYETVLSKQRFTHYSTNLCVPCTLASLRGISYA